MFKLNTTVGNTSSSNINNVQIEMQLLDDSSNITAYVEILTFVQNNSTVECKLNATV